ncbi:MAG: hypothetical protein ACK56I_00585, partial [bacterium]
RKLHKQSTGSETMPFIIYISQLRRACVSRSVMAGSVVGLCRILIYPLVEPTSPCRPTRSRRSVTGDLSATWIVRQGAKGQRRGMACSGKCHA